ncbi:MAG TPA: NAD-dependent epimerase/dehydratase family protein [Patescibacteria group bacterium]|nr:NAD-dependent epimerase/dehydratase family protein [Patescibacteria group bacterium]
MKEIHNILVTGATGGIGSEVMRQASNYPHLNLVPAVRNESYIAQRVANNLPVRYLDIENSPIDDFYNALEGMDAVIHLAASTSEKNDFDLHDRTNRLATLKLAVVASHFGLPLIIAGSIVQNAGNEHGVIDENMKPKSNSAYANSKTNAFNEAKMLERPDSDYKVIQGVPAMTLGSGSNWNRELTRLVRNGATRFGMRAFLNKEIAWSDQTDVANMFIQLAANPHLATHDRYFLMNGMINTNEIFGLFTDLAGVDMPKTPIARWKAQAVGDTVLLCMKYVHGMIQPISREVLAFALDGGQRQFVATAANEDYGFKFKSFEETAQETRDNFVLPEGEITTLVHEVSKKIPEGIGKKATALGIGLMAAKIGADLLKQNTQQDKESQALKA